MTHINKEFPIPDRISEKKGHGGLRYFELCFNGAEAHLYLQGAHVLHYQPVGQQPVLWQSKESWFEPGKPIRGGIPICWPWFGPHPSNPEQPSHGIARLVEWEIVDKMAKDSVTKVILKLPESSYPNVSLQLTLELSDELSVTLTTVNKGETTLNFTEALHSYFAIQDINKVTVSGLEGQKYINQLAPDSVHSQKGPISFTEETDRIYINTKESCIINNPTNNRKIQISKENSLSTVVWNPWVDKSIRMPDFGEKEFLEMVCVETANCGPNPVHIPPGESHALKLNIRTQKSIN